mgnify:CR=1 FL=1
MPENFIPQEILTQHLEHKHMHHFKESWEEGRDKIKILESTGGIQALVERLSDVEVQELFSNNNERTCGCIDDGAAYAAEVHSPGSGVLQIVEAAKKLVKEGVGANDIFKSALEESAREEARRNVEKGVTTVTSHEGCGAAGLCVAELTKIIPNFIFESQNDDIGHLFSETVVDEMRKLGIDAKYKRIKKEEMQRDHSHDAQAVYFDLTGKFKPDYNSHHDLPRGFVVSEANRKNSSDERSDFSGVNLAFKIANGGHGHENKFNEENKFMVYVIAPDADTLDEAKNNLNKFFVGNEKVKVDGFVKK